MRPRYYFHIHKASSTSALNRIFLKWLNECGHLTVMCRFTLWVLSFVIPGLGMFSESYFVFAVGNLKRESASTRLINVLNINNSFTDSI